MPNAPHPSVIMTPLSDQQAVLLHLKSKLYYSLNSMGHYLWQLLEKEPLSEAQLVQRLIDLYGLSPEQAAEDVRGFLKELRTEDLLQETPAAK